MTRERKGVQFCGLETELLSRSEVALLSGPVSLLSCLISPSIPTIATLASFASPHPSALSTAPLGHWFASWIWWPLPLQINSLSWKFLLPISKRVTAWAAHPVKTATSEAADLASIWSDHRRVTSYPRSNWLTKEGIRVTCYKNWLLRSAPMGRPQLWGCRCDEVRVGWWGWAHPIRRFDPWSSFCFSVAKPTLLVSQLLIQIWAHSRCSKNASWLVSSS